jgi:hypothetical protein
MAICKYIDADNIAVVWEDGNESTVSRSSIDGSLNNYVMRRLVQRRVPRQRVGVGYKMESYQLFSLDGEKLEKQFEISHKKEEQ